jgi:hypothetical protein
MKRSDFFRQPVVFEKTFTDQGDFAAVHAAEHWCESEGLSVGTMEADAPRGIKRGDWEILKWRNLDDDDLDKLDGTMIGEIRNGPVTVTLHRQGS